MAFGGAFGEPKPYEIEADLRREIEQLRTALQAVIDDIHDYERVNNLAPNPPRMECWDSVARARAALEQKSWASEHRSEDETEK